MLNEYSNGFYSGGKDRSLQPLNLLDRGVQIIAPFLVMQNPRVLIQARAGLGNPYLRPFAKTMELALAHLFHEIKLAENTLRPVVIDALFLAGLMKTGTMHKWNVELEGITHEVGQPYCDRIDWNDYVGDIAARHREEATIEGHKFRLPLEYVADSGFFKHYDRLKPDLKLYGDTDPERIAKPGYNTTEYHEHRPTVELYSLYLPREGIEVVIPPEGQGDKIMRVIEWDGPEGGPYDMLSLKQFPNSIIPIPPVYIWLDINNIVNVMARKMRDDVQREKTIGVYERTDEEDAGIIKEAQNGDLVGLRNPETTKEMTLGGFNDKSFPFLQYLEQQYAISYSNLYGIGGRGTQAETLGQEQMLQYNATRSLDDMIDQFHNTVRSVTRKLAWFLWTDPLIQVPVIKQERGIDIPVTYSQSAQEGDFFDYTFDINPHSMSRMNPDMKYQKLLQLISGVILPLLPMAQQQGSMLNVDELVREFGEYLGENVENWWISSIPQTTPNPYTPEQGTFGQMNDSGGASPGSKEGNLNQFMASGRAGKPSPPNSERTS